MTDINDKSTRRTATAAILLDNNNPALGARPSIEELWDWIHDELPETRAAEIKTHIASDGDIYEQWRQLRMAIDEEADEKAAQSVPASHDKPRASVTDYIEAIRSKFRQPFFPAQTAIITATLAVVGIGIALLPTPHTTDNLWANWQQPKSTTPTDITEDTRSAYRVILHGMGEALAKRSLPATGPQGKPLPRDTTVCQAGNECYALIPQLKELGGLLISAQAACVSGDQLPASLASALDRLQSDLSVSQVVAPLQFPLNKWQKTTDQNAQCAAVENVIARTLPALDSR